MRRKAWVVIILLVVLGMAVGACKSATGTGKQAQQAVTDLGGREIIWAVDNAYPPFSFLDENGNGIGFDYDLAQEVCKRANCKPKFKEFAWEGIFEACAAGEFDINMGGCTLDVERAKTVDFSDPFYTYGQVVIVRADDTSITDEASLISSGKKIATQAGTTNEKTAIARFGEENVVLYDTFEMPVTALLAGDVDAVLIDEVAAVGFARENPGKLKTAFRVSSGEMLALFMPPGSPLQPAVDKALNDMWADGTMEKLIDKWLVVK